jgi:hypothetical protein
MYIIVRRSLYSPGVALFVVLPFITTVVSTASADSDSFLINATLRQYAAQKDLYSEGEGEPAGESIFLPWEQYATLGGIITLALGIVWIAEEPPSPCMVATAAYGTQLSPGLTLLRTFRDQILLDTALGTAFVDVYYRVGTDAAYFVAKHRWAAWLVRLALAPLILVVALVLCWPGILTAAGYSLLVTAALIVVYWLRRTWGLYRPDVQANLDR